MNKLFAEFIGLMIGDGCLSISGRDHRIYIAGHKMDDKEYHETFTKPLFKKLFLKDVIIEYRKQENTLFIRVCDKKLLLYLSKYLPIGRKYDHLSIPPEIIKNKNYLFSFIRGFIDTDGCLIFSKQHRR